MPPLAPYASPESSSTVISHMETHTEVALSIFSTVKSPYLILGNHLKTPDVCVDYALPTQGSHF